MIQDYVSGQSTNNVVLIVGKERVTYIFGRQTIKETKEKPHSPECGLVQPHVITLNSIAREPKKRLCRGVPFSVISCLEGFL